MNSPALIEDCFTLDFVVQEGGCDNLLSFLSRQIVPAHTELLPDLLKHDAISVNDLFVSQDLLLQAGDTVRLSIPGHREDPVRINWKMLWQNSDLMVVYKPPLLPVSRTTRNLYQTLISLVRRQTPYPEASLLHRLDTETSGIILLAKDRNADRYWKPRLQELLKDKVYHAWVSGRPEWVELDYSCLLAEKQDSAIRSQVYVAPECGGEGWLKPRTARTVFRLLRTEGERSLIECCLHSGRKHQIRAQLAHLGLPIVGDKIYSHQGVYYLKRIEQGLDQQDLTDLGSEHHLLQAVSCTLYPDQQGKGIHISLLDDSNLQY